MKQLKTVLAFEYSNYVKSKAFLVVTILFAIIIIASGFIPRVMDMFSGSDKTGPDTEKEPSVLYLVDESGYFSDTDSIALALNNDYKIEIKNRNEIETLKTDITSEKTDKAEALILIDKNLKLTYYENQSNMFSSFYNIYDILNSYLQSVKLAGLGFDSSKIQGILAPMDFETVELGKSFLPSYIVSYSAIILLYMTVVIYGQLVAASVAKEKSSRAMEILVTTVKPTYMIFGKVIGSGLAGLTQLVIWMCAGILSVSLNSSYLSNIDILKTISETASTTLIYVFVFYLLGFFVYAFLYAGFGSLVSKMEELNTVLTPVVLILVAAYLVGIYCINLGESTFTSVMSFIPFFTPIIMFLRISMYRVETWEIILSLCTTALSCVLLGWVSAKIYRMGVLMYGKPPKIKEIFKAFRSK